MLPTLSLLLALAPATVAPGTRLLRFPDIHGDAVVFCYGGDLWRAPTSGGTAIRLTAHPGQEVFPRFSPDGKWIAFTGQYDGDEQVYVMPSEGGEPRRLTWYPARGPLPPRWGYDHQVYGWTPEGDAVLFRSLRDAGGGSEGRLYTVPIEGGLPRALPMPTSGAGDFSPDGQRMVYSPLFRDFRHWKRYEGGWAQDLFVFDLESHEATPLANSARTERDPMWIEGSVVFASDRGDRLNLYRADPATGEVEALTAHDPWDVRWPATDHRSRIVYELNGELRIFDLTDRSDVGISIDVPDDGLWKRPRRVSVADAVSFFGLSPEGERALFVARGDVFTVPVEEGRPRNLTRSSGAHDRLATWSPDGRAIAYVSDATGEDEVWLAAADGSQPAGQLTRGSSARLTGLRWSPANDRLALTDYLGRLFVVDAENGSTAQIADDPRGGIGGPRWSPDGTYLAFGLRDESGLRRLCIWSAEGGVRPVTPDLFEGWSPAWSPCGEYLFFLSNRAYAPQISSLEWNYAGNERTGIFALALTKGTAPLFPPPDDIVADEQEPIDDVESGSIAIDFEGLSGRVMRVPVEPANYSGLVAVDGHLLYTSSGPFVYGGSSGPSVLHRFSIEEREATDVTSGTRGYALSANGEHLMVRTSDGFRLFETLNGTDSQPVPTGELAVDLDPTLEWGAIFDEAWRLFRDYFYVANMHGYDWTALRERYAAQLSDVAHRSDLNYVISEMISELNAGHTYIAGGDFEIPERAPVGLPGARFELDEAAGRYRIASLFPGHNEEDRYRSPLTEVGVDVRVGDYVVAIDGRELRGTDNPYRLLRHLEGVVEWTVSASPNGDDVRQVRYRPVPSESSLVYLDWVLENHARVTEMSGGRVGYLHLPNMGADGIAEFIKWYYPQIRKEGLVVDVRSNGGGNVSAMIIERLSRKVLGTRFGRIPEAPSTYPGATFHGHLVCLISETSASDGDIFPHYFREAGLGPLIGKRTWGGVVGGGNMGLVDGGTVFVPRSATNDRDGNYIIEGEGVAPDIEVANDPASVLAGGDPQLERGVSEVLAAIEREPKRLPGRPSDPVKTPKER